MGRGRAELRQSCPDRILRRSWITKIGPRPERFQGNETTRLTSVALVPLPAVRVCGLLIV